MNLTGATLPRIVLSGSRIVVGTGPALLADGLTVQGDVALDDHFYAQAAGDSGTIRLHSAHVGAAYH